MAYQYHGQDSLLTLQLKCYYKGLLAKCVLHSIVVQIWWIKIQSDECFGFNQTPPPASPPRVHSIVVANGGASPRRLGSISLNSAFKSRYLCYVAWRHCRSPPPPIWLLTNRRMMNQDESRSNLTRRNSSGYWRRHRRRCCWLQSAIQRGIWPRVHCFSFLLIDIWSGLRRKWVYTSCHGYLKLNFSESLS